MTGLPKRIPGSHLPDGGPPPIEGWFGATIVWPPDDPDMSVLARYVREPCLSDALAAETLCKRVLDGLHNLGVAVDSSPAQVAPDDTEIRTKVAATLAVLRSERERRGWTLDDLSARLHGTTSRQLEDLEKGTLDLGLVQFIQICTALELDLNEPLITTAATPPDR